jgi:hypothetical protein
LKECLDFVATCFEGDVRLQHHETELGAILKAIGQIDDHRSFIVHGCKTEFFRAPLAVEFTKLDRTPAKDAYAQYSARITFAELGELADGASAVVRGLLHAGRLLTEVSGAQKAKDD